MMSRTISVRPDSRSFQVFDKQNLKGPRRRDVGLDIWLPGGISLAHFVRSHERASALS